MNVVFEWLQSALPDMAFNLGADATAETVYFKNCYSSAVSMCRLERNNIYFESQSPSTVAVFKEAITRQANFRRVTLNESTRASAEAVEAYLSLFQQNLDYQLSLARKVAVVDAVKEVTHAELGAASSSEGSLSTPAWLPRELHDVYRDSDRICKEYKEKGRVLDYICGVITGAHTDYYRLQGLASKTNPGAVKEAVLTGAPWEELLRLVVGESSSTSNSNSSGQGGGVGRRRSTAQWQPHQEEPVEEDLIT